MDNHVTIVFSAEYCGQGQDEHETPLYTARSLIDAYEYILKTTHIDGVCNCFPDDPEELCEHFPIVVRTYNIGAECTDETGKRFESVEEVLAKAQNDLQIKLNEHNSTVGSNKASKDVTKCERCGSDETTTVEKSLRASDEPITFRVTCVRCDYKWSQ